MAEGVIVTEEESARAGRAGRYFWEPDSSYPGDKAHLIRRDGSDHSMHAWGFTPDEVRELCRGHDKRENEALAALGSDDPTALCLLGWHRRLPGDGVSFDERQVFFRFRAGKIGGELRWAVGAEPVEFTATTITGIGPQAQPWICAICGSAVPATEVGA
jgi:hypothetical protein